MGKKKLLRGKIFPPFKKGKKGTPINPLDGRRGRKEGPTRLSQN